jgi:valyl-tRNA synthetase
MRISIFDLRRIYIVSLFAVRVPLASPVRTTLRAKFQVIAFRRNECRPKPQQFGHVFPILTGTASGTRTANKLTSAHLVDAHIFNSKFPRAGYTLLLRFCSPHERTLVSDPSPTPSSLDSFPSQYDPRQFEDRIYEQWESARVFHSEPNPARTPYTIMIPPPNVTGVLHIGHTLFTTLSDALIRYRRMTGRETLWMPGTDHAGISTQIVVEKQIAKAEKKNRYQIGRAELIKRVWQFKEESGGTILKQLRKLGASCDWDRTRFTMDDMLCKAVRHAFKRLYDDGLIYRGKKYLVNWCPSCRTTLSDDEVEHEDVKGKLYELRYPLVDCGAGFQPAKDDQPMQAGSPHHKQFLTVATTRPETMLGDTAVAVHPDDERYTQYVGRFVELPLTGRKIPVIADSALELGFGTGCLKVTPAHDPVDYAIGQRHKLPSINILTEGGAINENAPPQYRGLDRFKAREKVVADLKALGLVGDIKDHPQQVGHCYRCHSIVEPYLTAQWFVSMKPLSELAVKASAEGRVKFHPERWTKVYLKWFEEVRDWPISRQIWWGHRIPVWYDLDENKDSIIEIVAGENEPYDVEENGKRIRYLIGENAKPIVSEVDPDTLPQYKGRRLIQDADVLDTWFSSGLWPFSTLGWPDKTPELDYYYPTDTMVTARGIIYFWVARMVMLGEKLVGKEPFRDVVITSTMLDGDGQIMSKSKGNGIDPLDVIKRYGADALRFTILDLSTGGQDLKFPVQIICPHCNESQELPRKRTNPVMTCRKCKKEFQQPVPNEKPLAEPMMGTLDSPRFEKGRNFVNKFWNAARFVMTSICGAGFQPAKDAGRMPAPQFLDEDRWILSRLNSTIKAQTRALEEFEFSKASGALYDFFWNEFCAWYIELAKPRMAENADAADRSAAQAVLLHVLDRSMRLLHPLCPFVSEALWAELNKRVPPPSRRPDSNAGEDAGGTGLLAAASWPKPDESRIDNAIESQFASLFDAVVAVRAVRQELIDNAPRERKKDVGTALSGELSVAIRTEDAALAHRLREQRHILMRMAETKEPQIGGPELVPPKPASATAIKGGTIYVALSADLVDVEKLRLAKEIKNLEQYIPRVEGKLKNDSFVKNAPPELVDEERGRLREAKSKLDSLSAALRAINTGK